jgi:3-(3-hydroxy-phenyl)propionate hydroxylase
VKTVKRARVIIAGAGPVGTVAAYYLARQGIDVMVLEAGPNCAQDLRASTFHPPTLEMLEQLDITSVLLERGLKAPLNHFRDRRTGDVISFDFSELADISRYPFRIQCEQYHLSRALADRLDAHPNAEVLFGRRVLTVEQDGQGVSLNVEGPFSIESYRADYLIAADGANSIVRKWLGIEFDGFTYPEKFLCLTTDTPLEEHFPGLATVNYVSDPKEWLVLLKVPTLWRILVPANEDDSDEYLLSDQKKTKVFDGLLGPEASAASRTFHRTIYRVHQRVAKTFRDKRIFIIGDAAHLNNPLGGFGMNSGVHDAFNLCEKLIEVMAGRAGDSLLDLFERQRRTVTHSFTQRQTIQNMEYMKQGADGVHAARRAHMRAVAADPEQRRAHILRQSMYESLTQAAAIQ